MMDVNALSALEQVINDSWGSASTNDSQYEPYAHGTVTTRAVKASLQGSNKLRVMYITTAIVDSSEQVHAYMLDNYKDAVKVVDGYMKDVKKEFKELYGKALKVKRIDDRPTIEPITHSHCNPSKMVYYRLFVNYEVSA